MTKPIRSLHHVTATVADAQKDLDFYTRVLGQRLVKKTVNFDNHHVYHFYYGNEAGAPGTIMTTFPYKAMGVRNGLHGAGQITATSFSVPEGSLSFWRDRFTEMNVAIEDEAPAFGEEAIQVGDPSGLVLRLVAGAADTRTPWLRPGISKGEAIRGIHSVKLLVRDPSETIEFMRELMDITVIGQHGTITRVAVSGNQPGHLVEVARADDAPNGINGLGTVHHVAFAVDGPAEQRAIRDTLVARGVPVTEVMDRQYFTSIYFREPNGVLFEVATAGPGFTADEPLAELGRGLKLPPWEEPHRAAIEAGLPRVSHS